LDYVRLNGGPLNNYGTVSPGGWGVVQTTALDGAYVQTASGVYDFDLDLAHTGHAGEVDLLAATGTAQLQGSYVLNVLDPDDALPGSHVATIISAQGGLSASNLMLDAPSSVIARFELINNVQNLDIHYTINFAPTDIGLNLNQLAVGQHINAIQTAGSPAFGPIAGELFYVSSPDTLKAIYDSFSPETYADEIAAVDLATERFTDSMMSCPLSTDQFKVRGDSCAWAKATGTWLGLQATANNQAFDEQSAGVAGGYEKQVSGHIRLGYALSADNVTGGMGFRNDASGMRYQGGLVAKGDWADWGLDLAAAFGTEKLSTSRTVLTPQNAFTALGQQRMTWEAYTARFSRTWRYDGRFGGLYAKPMFEVSDVRVRNGPLAETGAGPLDLDAPAQWQNEARISPKLELGAETLLGGFAYRPYVRGGFTRVLDGEEPLFDAAFASAPAGVPDFVTTAKLDRMTADAEAGLTIVGPGGASARLGWFGQFGKRTDEQGAALKFTLPF
ncbi:MAG TPA: autotransporter outer membrane beta-barrel domain-containing protein, partial [Alphaproteobacteria bacterium]|nr:autotransporter outer membrane beta-barrel domain-containing protein [Alphaproteobacteria bacterium]